MITLDEALDQFRSDTSTANGELLWSVASSYKDDGILSDDSWQAIYEEIADSGVFD